MGSLHGDRQLHVVIVPSPSKGHTIPFMNLTKQLVGHGVRVTFVSSDNHIESLEQAKGSQELGQAGMDKVRFVGLSGGPATFIEMMDEAIEARMAKLVSDWIATVMRKSEERMNGQINEAGAHGLGNEATPCCIISDMFGGWTHDVAKKFGIASHVLFTSPAACAAMQLQIPKYIAEGILPLPASSNCGFVSVPGIPPLKVDYLPVDLIREGSSINYKFYTRNTLRLSDATCILVNSFYDLESSVFDAVNRQILNSTLKVKSFIPIGPLLPVEHQLRPEDRHPAEKWLDTQEKESVIYVAFGSGVVFTPDQILELAHGLEACEQPFVLVLQLPKTDDKTKSDYFPSGYEERTKDRGVIVTDWAPQVRILNHPATGAFMTHCGWNSSLESIAAGVPMIAWPMMAEQKMNCRFLVDTARLAIEAFKEESGLVTRIEVERVVRLLMRESLGSEIHTNANTMCNLAHRAIAPGGSSTISMECFLSELINYNDPN